MLDFLIATNYIFPLFLFLFRSWSLRGRCSRLRPRNNSYLLTTSPNAWANCRRMLQRARQRTTASSKLDSTPAIRATPRAKFWKFLRFFLFYCSFIMEYSISFYLRSMATRQKCGINLKIPSRKKCFLGRLPIPVNQSCRGNLLSITNLRLHRADICTCSFETNGRAHSKAYTKLII